MAEALGWGKQPIGWAEILRMAQTPEGWAKHGFPQWGRFKFGHTHPLYSNSGLISLTAEVYAGAGKVRGLTLEDTANHDVGEFLEKIEQSVVHYGSSTGFFGRKMFAGGPEYLSAAVLYENLVIESYDPKHELPFPIVAVYPKEGTFWSDHPVGIVKRDWVTDEHREAAQTYIDFLLETPQQQRAIEFGFRPADVTLTLGAPIDIQHGVDPQQPQTTLEVPTADVLEAVLQLWKERKKHANVVLALDVSGSMRGRKLTGAREGARELVSMLGDRDHLSLILFNHEPLLVQSGLKMGAARDTTLQSVESAFAGGGTALYDAIGASIEQLAENPTPDRITAVVVLSDGADEHSASTLEQLLEKIDKGEENQGTRIFTIGYGTNKVQAVLERIANATGAKYYEGAPETIREVFKEISTFF
jgi:Ca-activated chloride channel family protein